MEMPIEGDRKACPLCEGILTFCAKTPVPSTGAGFVDPDTSRGVVLERGDAPGWSCADCGYIEVALKVVRRRDQRTRRWPAGRAISATVRSKTSDDPLAEQ